MSGFEDAIRRYLGVPADADISVEMEGGNQVQIGDYTWETEPYQIEITAYFGVGPKRDYKSITFGTLPEVWEALWPHSIAGPNT